jgi:hypothetical protein
MHGLQNDSVNVFQGLELKEPLEPVTLVRYPMGEY